MKRRRKNWVVAMDGPAGVGKSTVGRLVAKMLGYVFLNTGEMYRALTWKALNEGIDPADNRAVLSLARKVKWGFNPDRGGVIRTYVDRVLVNSQIRQEKVSRNSSAVAGNPGVRRLMRRMQRALGSRGGIVVEGRDMTTNVFPDADYKIYLDASLNVRAIRRCRQLKAQGHTARLDDIRMAIRERDLKDVQRKINPLCQAPDALVIDTTHLPLKQVASRILRYIRVREKCSTR